MNKLILFSFAIVSAFSFSAASLSFIDSRDGTGYKVVKIGNQNWMAENLSYKTQHSRCYDNKPANCKKYGSLYNWFDAVHVCPEGWRLPTSDDFLDLKTFIYKDRNIDDGDSVGNFLKSTRGWKGINGNGRDWYGFNAYPAGTGGDVQKAGLYSDLGGGAYFWTTTYPNTSSYIVGDGHVHSGADGEPTDPVGWYLYNDSKVFLSNQYPAESYLSVRCIQADNGNVFARGKELFVKDVRDEKEYAVTVVGDRYWLAENLVYESEGSWESVGSDETTSSGRFYDINYLEYICPQGWNIPTPGDVEALIYDYAGGKMEAAKHLKKSVDLDFDVDVEIVEDGTKEKTKALWKGDNVFGLNMLPGGYIADDDEHVNPFSAVFVVDGRINRDDPKSQLFFWLNLDFDAVAMGRFPSVKGVNVRCVRPIHPQREVWRLDLEREMGLRRRSSLQIHRHLIQKETSKGQSSNLESKPRGEGFVDSRTGTFYNTVKIGKQIWMKQNIIYSAGADATCLELKGESTCSSIGHYYRWNAVKQGDVCPDGWRVPSKKDFDILIKKVGGVKSAGKKLKATFMWEEQYASAGTDEYGFGMFPFGIIAPTGETVGLGMLGCLLTSTSKDSNEAYSLCVGAGEHVDYMPMDKNAFVGVRCLKK